MSAIVPFWGVESYFRQCLDSIRAQNMPDFEVLCIDDGSLDGSGAIAEEFAASDARFRVIRQANAGLGPARNTGARHATGRYLMFIDSDDLLAPRAFSQLSTSLEQSGSDFAGGHVWRWSVTRGLETAWSHREPFAERLQGTHITELPILMRDRMVWNKMWRRSFWEARGYQFPAIRFEDFPITLLAHLEATAVDTLPDPLYVWRERPSSDSISQSGRSVANVRDRVTAATTVLEFVDRLGTDELRELVHSHLVDVDLREVMGSLLIALPPDQPEMIRLAGALAGSIRPELTQLAHRELRIGHEALRRGDIEHARNVARWWHGERSDEALGAVGRTRTAPAAPARHRRLEWTAPTLRAKKRNARVMGVTVVGRTFHYRATVNIAPRLARSITAQVAIGNHRPAVRVSPLPRGIQLEFEVDTREVARVQPTLTRLELTLGPQRWEGFVSMHADQSHGVRRAGRWIQVSVTEGAMTFTAHPRAHVIHRLDSVERDGRTFVRLHVDTWCDQLAVRRPWPDDPLLLDVRNGLVEVPFDKLVADPLDEPVHRTVTRELVARRPRAGYPGEFDEEPLRLACPGLVVVRGERRVEIRGADDAGAHVRISHPPHTLERLR